MTGTDVVYRPLMHEERQPPPGPDAEILPRSAEKSAPSASSTLVSRLIGPRAGTGQPGPTHSVRVVRPGGRTHQ